MSTSARLACLFAVLACSSGFAKEPRELKGHTKWVGALAFSRDSKWLVTGSADRTARVWDIAGQRDIVRSWHDDIVSAVAAGPKLMVVAGSYEGSVVRWGPPPGAVFKKRRGAVLAVAISTDGDTVAAGGMEGIIYLTDSDGKQLGKLIGHKSWVSSLGFRGKRLVSGSSDGTVKLWDTKAKKLLKTFTLPDPREVRCAAISPDGTAVAAACRFGAVKVWEVETGKEAASLDAHEGDAWSVCFTPDGKTLVSGGGDWGKPGKVRLWDVKTWKEKASFKHPGEVLCVAVSPDGQWLAAAGMSKTVRVWELKAKK